MIVHLEKLSTTIIKARFNKGFSQTFMAHKLGISQKAYSYIESGHCRLDLIRFLKIADYTGTHPMFIIEKITEGTKSWESIQTRETALVSEIEKLEAQIVYLKSHNTFLKETVIKLLDKQK
jgi:transcriptional regulator with XRE-family HTH domain